MHSFPQSSQVFPLSHYACFSCVHSIQRKMWTLSHRMTTFEMFIHLSEWCVKLTTEIANFNPHHKITMCTFDMFIQLSSWYALFSTEFTSFHSTPQCILFMCSFNSAEDMYVFPQKLQIFTLHNNVYFWYAYSTPWQIWNLSHRIHKSIQSLNWEEICTLFHRVHNYLFTLFAISISHSNLHHTLHFTSTKRKTYWKTWIMIENIFWGISPSDWLCCFCDYENMNKSSMKTHQESIHIGASCCVVV